jgi:predicted enzyme related to lactoylglutathione lyase
MQRARLIGVNHVALEVPDVEAALVKAESLGGTRVMGPEDIMGQVVLGQFKDPEGHMVGVVQSGS